MEKHEPDRSEFRHLPPRIKPEDMVETADVHTTRDRPDSSLDPELLLMLRYGAPG